MEKILSNREKDQRQSGTCCTWEFERSSWPSPKGFSLPYSGSARAELALGVVRGTLTQSVSQGATVISYDFLRAVPVILSSAFKENSEKKDLGIS